MESSALNVAHQQHRKADTHLRYKRFDEAVQCHQNAASMLKEAMKLTSVTRALESLHLQHDYHVRQQEIIRLKKDQFETFKRALENKKKMSFKFVKDENLSSLQQEEGKNNLQLAIYKTMEEADSLLQLLVRHGDGGSDADHSQETCAQPVAAVIEGSKRPKDEQTVIEELQTLNSQLRALVMQLITQLDASVRETERLQSVVQRLEAEAAARENAPPGTGMISETNGTSDCHHTVTAGSAGGSSPFVFSPCGDLEGDANSSPRELPVLAPLEMPEFDFSVFSKRASSDSTL
ncbi:nuclear receptor-binding factor 2-like isoform X1 [Schistocerca americana]|uniref:nuclear receptor-binding factor 2-like isoform X1 n=2 Tax=Schistocerca americana TaxID=7009 RepID=UPI001F4F993F|nr:nuclear receptor-binding factor 2-like isoform X1 [Schistocerca americana]